MRGKRGPVQPSFHPSKNKDQQRDMNWIRPLFLWVLSTAADDDGTLGLSVLDAAVLIPSSYVAPVIVKVGVVSMSIIDLRMVWRGIYTTGQITCKRAGFEIRECEKSKKAILRALWRRLRFRKIIRKCIKSPLLKFNFAICNERVWHCIYRIFLAVRKSRGSSFKTVTVLLAWVTGICHATSWCPD